MYMYRLTVNAIDVLAKWVDRTFWHEDVSAFLSRNVSALFRLIRQFHFDYSAIFLVL